MPQVLLVDSKDSFSNASLSYAVGMAASIERVTAALSRSTQLEAVREDVESKPFTIMNALRNVLVRLILTSPFLAKHFRATRRYFELDPHTGVTVQISKQYFELQNKPAHEEGIETLKGKNFIKDELKGCSVHINVASILKAIDNRLEQAISTSNGASISQSLANDIFDDVEETLAEHVPYISRIALSEDGDIFFNRHILPDVSDDNIRRDMMPEVIVSFTDLEAEERVQTLVTDVMYTPDVEYNNMRMQFTVNIPSSNTLLDDHDPLYSGVEAERFDRLRNAIINSSSQLCTVNIGGNQGRRLCFFLISKPKYGNAQRDEYGIMKEGGSFMSITVNVFSSASHALDYTRLNLLQQYLSVVRSADVVRLEQGGGTKVHIPSVIRLYNTVVYIAAKSRNKAINSYPLCEIIRRVFANVSFKKSDYSEFLRNLIKSYTYMHKIQDYAGSQMEVLPRGNIMSSVVTFNLHRHEYGDIYAADYDASMDPLEMRFLSIGQAISIDIIPFIEALVQLADVSDYMKKVYINDPSIETLYASHIAIALNSSKGLDVTLFEPRSTNSVPPTFHEPFHFMLEIMISKDWSGVEQELYENIARHGINYVSNFLTSMLQTIGNLEADN